LNALCIIVIVLFVSLTRTSMSMTMTPSLAIIGGGFSGLCAAKSAIENGLRPELFEKQSSIGGLWRPQTGTMWQSLRTNLSQYTCMFSDFPFSVADNFPSHTQVYEYLKQYVEAFKLEHNALLHFNHIITRVSREEDGKWRVTWTSPEGDGSKVFDNIIISSGFFSEPVNQKIPQEQPVGTPEIPTIHSSAYRNPADYKGKVVAVIGAGYSGTEIASDLAKHGVEVVVVARRKEYILPRYANEDGKHVPVDTTMFSRVKALRKLDPEVRARWFDSMNKTRQSTVDSISVDNPENPYVAISDDYVQQVKDNKIKFYHGQPSRIVNDQLYYIKVGKDAEEKESIKIDQVILCSGFTVNLKYLDQEILDAIHYDPSITFQPMLLHKAVFCQSMPGIAFVGMYRGPYLPVVELQARWATGVFANKYQAPAHAAMAEGIQSESEIRNRKPPTQFPRMYVPYSEDLAKEMNIAPDLEYYKSNNEPLYKMLNEGFFLGASYRLSDNQDPVKAAAAKEFIMRISTKPYAMDIQP
ncbi:hypothetical protein SAMD00019534_108650, partial [Acytostelium subglobosum LB1]|uniref:hypothetical protein n=1 Tax=Acytostelium subglobosum LB1 TaxID=1410327 RepID=UPI00064517FD